MNSSTSAASRQPSKLQRILIGCVVALVVGASLYGYGYWKGRSQLGAQKSDYDSKTQEFQARLDKSQSDLLASQNQMRLFQAQAGLYRIAIDLEMRNFGIANTRLQECAALLGTVQNAAEVDMTRLGALRDAMAKTNINVAVDLGTQRQQTLDFATQLDALMNKTSQSTTTTPNTVPATNTNASPDSQTVPTPAIGTGPTTDANTATGDATAPNPPIANAGTPIEGAANSVAPTDSTPQNSAIPAEPSPTTATTG